MLTLTSLCSFGLVILEAATNICVPDGGCECKYQSLSAYGELTSTLYVRIFSRLACYPGERFLYHRLYVLIACIGRSHHSLHAS